MIINIETKEQFEELKSTGVVLIDFWAPWCGPCKMLAPQLEGVSEEMPEVKILKVNVDSFHEIASEYGVSAIPTMYLLINGEESAKNVGFLPKPSIIYNKPNITFIQSDIDLISESTPVEKSCFIPEWLNRQALAKNLNFSKILQDGLIANLQPV